MIIWERIPEHVHDKALRFAEKFVDKKMEKDSRNFGNNRNTRPRSKWIQDNYRGKIGEAAVAEWLIRNGVEATPDYRIGRTRSDNGQDIQAFPPLFKKVQIKTLWPHQLYQVIEDYKMGADVFITVLLDKNGRADMSGFFYFVDFYNEDREPLHLIRRGERLPHPVTKIEIGPIMSASKSVYLPLELQRQTWDRMLQYIVKGE